MIETKVRDWGHFASLVARAFSDGNWIFRGVSRSSYELQPKVGRVPLLLKLMRGDHPFDDVAERWILDEFKLAARPHLQFEPKCEAEWLAVAQHHGLPTRLLDWTQSPFIAAYFAAREPAEMEMIPLENPPGLEGYIPIFKAGAVYALPTPRKVTRREAKFPFAIPMDAEPKLYQPPHLSPRVTVQRAVLTLHSNPKAVWAPKGLRKIEIPGDAFPSFRKALNLAGINEAAMFPDLDGISRHLGWCLDQTRSNPFS